MLPLVPPPPPVFSRRPPLHPRSSEPANPQELPIQSLSRYRHALEDGGRCKRDGACVCVCVCGTTHAWLAWLLHSGDGSRLLKHPHQASPHNAHVETDAGTLRHAVLYIAAWSVMSSLPLTSPLITRVRCMQVYKTKVGPHPNGVSFIFDGMRLEPDDTAASLLMEDSDVIVALARQIGD